MSLAVALPFALAGAIAYGAAAAVQHDAVGQSADGAARLVSELLHDLRWWASVGGDGLGLVLQLVALATGPVVLIQPLFVLCLPVALPIRALLGGARPGRSEYLSALVLALALGAFFLIAGHPATAAALGTPSILALALIALVAGVAVCGAVWTVSLSARAVVLSAVSGAWFGVEAVLANATATAWDHYGWHAFAITAGLVPAGAAVVLGLLGFALTQVAFRSGNLATSFPAMLVVDPLVAVLLGAFLLGESVRSSVWALVGYVLCAVVIAGATLRLARPDPLGPDHHAPVTSVAG
ncbi:MAG: hypothetical protein JWM76_2458 [Pseudonocardiales bacterium]|nr:hypothetical protein [Pseudonocardiales bacterium]